MRYIIWFTCVIFFCLNTALANTDSATLHESKEITIALASELGDTVTYYDQGFASLMNNQLDVSSQGALVSALHDAIKQAFSKSGYNVIIRDLSTQETKTILESTDNHRDLFPSPEERATNLHNNGILSTLNSTGKIDLLIVLRKIPARYEHFNGLGVVTKNGALGFTHITRIYLAAQMAIYQIEPAKEIGLAQTDIAYEEIPSIYRNWDKEVVPGLSSETKEKVLLIISKMLQELTREAFHRLDYRPA